MHMLAFSLTHSIIHVFLGMRIELLLEDGKQAMVQSAATATASAFELSNCTLNLQSYLLSDVVLRYTLLHKHKNTHIHSHPLTSTHTTHTT